MSAKYIVNAQDRSAHGLNYVHRGGRAWPGGQDVVVEVLDQDECPMVDSGKPGFDKVPDKAKIGKTAWSAISTDKRISIRPFGAPSANEAVGELVEARKQVAELTAEIEGAKEAHAELVAKLETLTSRESALVVANEELQAQVAELTAEIESLTAPKSEEKPAATPAKGSKSVKG
jgi:hypothetical protein